MLMNIGLRRAATSLLLIVLVALGTRVAFTRYEVRQIPAQALSIAPFQTETGHIAYSITTGKGFSSPFQRDTGPTAGLAPVYPYRGNLQTLWRLHPALVFRRTVSEYSPFRRHVRADFLRRHTHRDFARSQLSGMAVGALPQRHHHSLRMDLGHVPVRALY